MNFLEAVRSALRQYVRFSGRARRREYWWFFLFTIGVSVAAAIIDANLFGSDWKISPYGYVTDAGPLGTLCGAALLLPSLAVAVRRLHDVGRRGWFLLFGLIPIVGYIVLLAALLDDSGPDNVHGPSPKSPTPSMSGPADI